MARFWKGKGTSQYVRTPKRRRHAAKPKDHSANVKNSSRYVNRQKVLNAIGFETCKDYLASELWASIWARIMERDNRRCRACGRPAVQVHHITYSEEVLSGKDDSQLIAICRGCHKATEFEGETKLTYTTDITKQLAKRVRTGKSARKSVRKAMWPRCVCCKQQRKELGRDDICMGCYKTGKALRFRQSQAAKEQA